MKLNIGCGRNILEGWNNLDVVQQPGVDTVFDLNACSRWHMMPFAANSVDEFLLSHVIEHIPNTLPLMQELWRIAKPMAVMTIRCPHGGSDDAWEDPTHVRAYFPHSFGYFSQPYYWRADYGYRGDWSTSVVELHLYPNSAPLHDDIATVAIHTRRNIVSEMVAHLTAVKPIRPPDRGLRSAPWIRIVRPGVSQISQPLRSHAISLDSAP